MKTKAKVHLHASHLHILHLHFASTNLACICVASLLLPPFSLLLSLPHFSFSPLLGFGSLLLSPLSLLLTLSLSLSNSLRQLRAEDKGRQRETTTDKCSSILHLGEGARLITTVPGDFQHKRQTTHNRKGEAGLDPAQQHGNQQRNNNKQTRCQRKETPWPCPCETRGYREAHNNTTQWHHQDT